MDKIIIGEALMNLHRKAIYEERDGRQVTILDSNHLNSCIKQIEDELTKDG